MILLILIFIALESSSLALYVLIAMHNKMASLEASIKYFTMGCNWWGLSLYLLRMLLYAVTGTLVLDGIATVITAKVF